MTYITNLANSMRPRIIEEVIGQQHLIGPNRLLWRMVHAKRLSSILLYGPPGIGKTSIAQALSGSTGIDFKHFNASVHGKKELQAFAKITQTTQQPLIILLDEIHRLTRPNQDFLLPFMESGEFIVIGATTENPYISVAPAIRSRSQILQLQPLAPHDIKIGLQRAMADTERGLGSLNLTIPDDALNFLAGSVNGDLRSAYTALEVVTKSTQPNQDGVILITQQDIQEVVQRKSIDGDRDGDGHYNLLSAFQKSIRGSDVDASLHYLARLIEIGDLVSIHRRLLVIAYEDIGLARPDIPGMCHQAIETSKQIGLPEARIPLAFIVIEMALSPKSNSAYQAIDRALEGLSQANSLSIPNHLKDTHFKGAANLGHVGYLYPHDFEGGWVAQHYLPTDLQHARYFKVHEDASEHEQTLLQIADHYINQRKQS